MLAAKIQQSRKVNYAEEREGTTADATPQWRRLRMHQVQDPSEEIAFRCKLDSFSVLQQGWDKHGHRCGYVTVACGGSLPTASIFSVE